MSEDRNGWIEWKGGECPVCLDELVDVRFDDDKTSDTRYPIPASLLIWENDKSRSNIIAYRKAG